ncbi:MULTISPECIES: DUF4340 domain-containing protein [unclassified Aureispira]|uniref:DUF4340 domain-containing protein n=1 Tax=unclassified Aureispira TaxID=2649989 RepID=UPI0006984292|nr:MULTISPECIES: DUF4340 domain-containing protein [unclassified Aureispira]WMX14952.1 DUF4340 domain-containing protein [Aureispira sp. CCB-E]
MGRIIALLVLFLGLGAFTFWKINNPGTVKDTYSENLHTMFALKNTDQIQRVFLVDRFGNEALVERVEELNWTYTNKTTGKKYRANPSAVYMLLETIRKVRTREPINKAAMDNAVKSLAAKATKVEIYDKDKNKLRVFYVGPMTSGGTGNLIIMEGSDQPYVGYIPNFQGTIDTRFITTEKDWRDKAIFRNDVDKLEFVQVEYQAPSQKTQSFKVSKIGSDQYTVDPVDPSSPVYDQSLVNQDNAATYFEDFDVISAEKIFGKDYKETRDSIITTTPFAVVTYKATYHNEPQVFRLYSLYNPNADRGDGEVGHRQKIQRYFIDIDEDNFFLGQHLVLRSMLWGYDFFFQKQAVILDEDEAQTTQSFPENKEEIRAAREKNKEAQ